AAPEPPLENTGRIERDGDDSLISAILDPDSDGSDGPADRDDPSLAADLKRLGEVYSALHKYAEAESLFAYALEMLRKTLGPNHPDIVSNLHALAQTYREQARFTEAKKLLELSTAILEKAAGPERAESAVALEFYSEILRVLHLNAAGSLEPGYAL
ncbi:MAG TPA: tetratricopeptide repeat protein, partial [Bryobacteraceae bacterium]|nr:tetratricopeptide repeat protein [Bryobacteraceae bacterium]